MSLETHLALLGFAFVMSISPGPGNFLLLASGANFGFRRSIPLVLGISLGFLTMVFVVGIGLGKVLTDSPLALAALKILCAAYVLWLAFRIARSRTLGPAEPGRIERPLSFLEAALMQLVNPKAWAVALIVTVSFTDPHNYLASLVGMIALFATVNLPAISTWALSGAALGRLIGRGQRLVAFNIVMAVLLVASMLPVLTGAL
jgi:threonine/homoserine/homoserine lactone efflux protein